MDSVGFPEYFYTRFPQLETKHLWLREITFSDEQAIFQLFSDPMVTRYYNLEPLQEMKEAQAIIRLFEERFLDGTGIRWGICKAGEEMLIGTIGINHIEENGEALLGFDLMPAYWNQGYITEALQAIISFCIREINIPVFSAVLFPENKPSVRVLMKSGFSFHQRETNEKTAIWKYRATR